MKASQQLSPVERAVIGTGIDIDEGNCLPPVEPAHQGNLAPAQGAAAIEPGQQFAHTQEVGLPRQGCNGSASRTSTVWSFATVVLKSSFYNLSDLQPRIVLGSNKEFTAIVQSGVWLVLLHF